MKLIYDCVRDVLLCLEENLGYQRDISTQNILEILKNYSLEDINYTCDKLDEAGFIKTTTFIGGQKVIETITYNGHVFLDNIRDSNIWKQTKSTISKLSSVSLPIIQQVASQILMKTLGIM